MEGCSSNIGSDSTDKYSIKNLLFYRAIPNYEIPFPTNGHKVYTCKDCGDGFILESSYVDHISRKSVLIKYQCRYCSRRPLIFHNRCNLLSHIRSHCVRTATINVSDLWVEPLPLSFYKIKKDNVQMHVKPVSAQENDSSQLDKPPLPDNSLQIQNTPQPDCTSQPELPIDTKQSTNNTKSIIAPNNSGVNKSTCIDCKKDITSTGIQYKDRASHYMQYTNHVYSCPICLFNLPTVCGLRAHLRLHLKIPPFHCPECGILMNNKSVIYPYTHGCEGFNMMRATARSQCPTKKCNLFHPHHFVKHMTENHFKLIYKCSMCVVACFNESTMIKHSEIQNHDISPQRYYQCDLCPGRLVMLNQSERHIRSHNQSLVYPCWSCNKPFKQAIDFIKHHSEKHSQYDEDLKNFFFTSLATEECLLEQSLKKIYRVVKRCDQCLRNFTYKCQFEDINILPNSCPYKCTPNSKSPNNESPIKCPLCKIKIDQNWVVIKKHFADEHMEHRCLDAQILVHRLYNIKKYTNRDLVVKKTKVHDGGVKKRTRRPRQKRQQNMKMNVQNNLAEEIKSVKPNRLLCGKCQQECDTKESLQNHMLSHRDPGMAYQCMECGECFAVKTSFSTHLVLEHNEADVDSYINDKKCFNENAFSKPVENIVEEPLCENQCKICREQFECLEDLEKHFRVHGMAFLIKNSLTKSPNS